MGTILWLLTNVFFIAVRTQLMWVGYREGTKLITKFGGKIAQLPTLPSVLGLTVVGSGRHGGDGENASDLPDGRGQCMALADLLDKILPSMISVLTVWALYKLIGRKGMKVTTIILLVILFSMACSAFGILA